MEEMAKIKRRTKIALSLKDQSRYINVADLSKILDMETRLVRASMSAARRELAQDGVIIVNKLGHGYKVGDFEEFKVEVDKACRRALAQLSSMSKLIHLLEASGKVDGDFREMRSLITGNIDRVRVLYESPQYEDFGSYRDFKEAQAEAEDTVGVITPDFIKEIPEDMVDP